jgi:iron complex outermembrane receptor protein
VEGLSSRYSNSTGTQIAGSFAVANLKAGYRLSQGTLIEFGMRNIFDRLYAYSEGFFEPGRTAFVQFNTPL